ncbi:Uncharacterised protein [Vibrio cholerae]|nr:Uncharacterised protein [Vibrio cholerae]
MALLLVEFSLQLFHAKAVPLSLPREKSPEPIQVQL